MRKFNRRILGSKLLDHFSYYKIKQWTIRIGESQSICLFLENNEDEGPRGGGRGRVLLFFRNGQI